MVDVPEPVKKCAAILKAAGSDTEKFAALFMVTKLVKGADCNAHSKKILFEAIGFKFLKKLLLSNDVPEDCPPLVYKSVALSVLSSFCSEPELATHPEMLANIPVFLEIVQQADDDDLDDNLIVISESYECLSNIAAHVPGQKALLEVGAVSKMSEIYSQQSFQTDEALNILVTLVNRFGPNAWGKDPKPFHALVSKIALDFETDHSERKFELCGILHALLSSCIKDIIYETSSDETWPISIYKGLTDVLTSKIGKTQRDPALKLASVMVDVLGIEWCFKDEEKPKQFFLLLVQLCSIEVRMQLEDRSFDQIMVNADLVTACFMVLELSIAYVATDTLELEQKEKQQLYTALKGAFTAVINVLSKVSTQPPKKHEVLGAKDKVFICAMVRVLGAWLAQETSAMKGAVLNLLPFMLALANETFYAYRARRLAEKNKSGASQLDSAMETEVDPLSHVDVLRLLLPAMCHLTVDEKSRKIMLEAKEEEVLYECLVYHWSIAHYVKPVVPKSERGKVKGPEPELEPKVLEEMKDSRTAMVSICNIFMNITVLEAKLVEESTLFATLLKFLFNNVPELKNSGENIVLHSNMAILGLLLLKQQSKRVKKNDFSICRFIQSTIRFLWDAYNVDESNDSTTLVVAMSYKKYWIELMELWFLGMQTMSAVLTLIPWISEFAIESGWAQVKCQPGAQPLLLFSRPAVTSPQDTLLDGTVEYRLLFLTLSLEAGARSQSIEDDELSYNGVYHPYVGTLRQRMNDHHFDSNHNNPDKPVALTAQTQNAMVLELCEPSPTLVDILCEQYHLTHGEALIATQTFLRHFRLCPDNEELSLDKWRLLLWTRALGEKYANLAGDVYRRWLQLRYHYLALSPEVLSLLAKLRSHYLLALITNGPSRAQWEKVHYLNLRCHFDLILVSGDLPWEKPHSAIFLEACHFLGVEPANCLMVGDKLETDVQGGMAAGLGGTVWIPLSSSVLPNLLQSDTHPTFTLKSVTDLPRILPSPVKPVVRTKSRDLQVFTSLVQNLNLLSLPDLDDCNSNSSHSSHCSTSSDGS
uniref:Neurochondrin-like protein n=1 Tax=Timema tahoe TaxID=61484 RepID=A0A7R9IM28_9NEOP|nr:unnamed protein product [Timema tahoe]